MTEGLNHWGFVVASYGLTLAATLGLIAHGWIRMRTAEARRDRSRGK